MQRYCGSHAPQIATIIEFTHRVSTGLAFLGVVAIAIWAWRARLSRPTVRMAIASLVLIVTKALLFGAGLVLFKYAGSDSSPGRAVYLSAHLQYPTADWSYRSCRLVRLRPWPDQLARLELRGASRSRLWRCLSCPSPEQSRLSAIHFILSAHCEQGSQRTSSGTAPMLLRLRIWHPVIAAAASFYIAAIAMSLGGKRVVLLVLAQVAAGLLNMSLLAPIWMQLLHLLFADFLWISLILLTASVLVEQPTLRTELQSNIIPR